MYETQLGQASSGMHGQKTLSLVVQTVLVKDLVRRMVCSKVICVVTMSAQDSARTADLSLWPSNFGAPSWMSSMRCP